MENDGSATCLSTVLLWYGNIAAMAAVEDGHKDEDAKIRVTLNYIPPNHLTTSKYRAITLLVSEIAFTHSDPGSDPKLRHFRLIPDFGSGFCHPMIYIILYEEYIIRGLVLLQICSQLVRNVRHTGDMHRRLKIIS